MSMTSNWIPVKDLHPWDREYVLCCGSKGGMFVGWIDTAAYKGGDKATAYIHGGHGRKHYALDASPGTSKGGSMTKFLRDRMRAFTRAVMNDDWSYVKSYCKKYGVPLPKDERVMKAGIYKAVHECTDIPEEVKKVATEKCLKLGFVPFIWTERRKNNGDSVIGH